MTAARSVVTSFASKCVLCGVGLTDPVLVRQGLCDSCEKRPEAKRATRPRPGAARAFTPADKALIRSMHALLPALDLLRLLNMRMLADLGGDAPRYTLEQLQGEILTIAAPVRAASDWGTLRQLLAEAARDGVLARISPSTIDDFAAVFQLAPAQVMHLRDVIRHAQEAR